MRYKRFEGSYSTTPRYNTQAVVRETTVPADTFRAWERRYNVPKPHRTPSGQRLYSDHDVALIRWLRDRTDEGMTISQAIQLLNIESDVPVLSQSVDWATLQRRLVDALLRLQTAEADGILGEAFAHYPLEQVCVMLIQPAMVEIGEGWQQGRVSVGQEHFATNIVRRRLHALFSVYDVVSGAGTIVTACLPTEQHDIGLLVVSLMLVRRGYRVVYLGANVPVEGLIPVVEQTQADLVCLSATTSEAFANFETTAKALLATPQKPLIVVGGLGVDHTSPLLEQCAWIYEASENVTDQIVQLLAQPRQHRSQDEAR